MTSLPHVLFAAIVTAAASAAAGPPPYRWAFIGKKSTGTGDLPVGTAMRFGDKVYEMITPDGEIDRRHVAWEQTGPRSWRGTTSDGVLNLSDDEKTRELRVVAARSDLRLAPASDEKAASLDKLMLGQPTIEAACAAARHCCETVFAVAAGHCDLDDELRGMHSLLTCTNFIKVVNEMDNIPRQCGLAKVTPQKAPQEQRPRSFKQEQQETRARLKTLFATCRKGQDISSFVVYRGDDQKRKWKDTLRPGVADERAQADAMCARIKGFHATGPAKFVNYTEGSESEGRWLVWRIDFGAKKVAFALLRVGDTLAVGDIDQVE